MIHSESKDNDLYADAQRAFIGAHPHRDPDDLNNDLAAIEWRHGYIVGRNVKSPRNASALPPGVNYEAPIQPDTDL